GRHPPGQQSDYGRYQPPLQHASQNGVNGKLGYQSFRPGSDTASFSRQHAGPPAWLRSNRDKSVISLLYKLRTSLQCKESGNRLDVRPSTRGAVPRPDSEILIVLLRAQFDVDGVLRAGAALGIMAVLTA